MTTEQKILTKLQELSELNEISTRHTRAFIKECSQKKSELKDELNSLIKLLKRTGTEHPELRRYVR